MVFYFVYVLDRPPRPLSVNINKSTSHVVVTRATMLQRAMDSAREVHEKMQQKHEEEMWMQQHIPQTSSMKNALGTQRLVELIFLFAPPAVAVYLSTKLSYRGRIYPN